MPGPRMTTDALKERGKKHLSKREEAQRRAGEVSVTPPKTAKPPKWLPEALMMNITLENNFSETAFTVKEGENYHLRWFTPGGEIDLCGHATLATAYAVTRFVAPELEEVELLGETERGAGGFGHSGVK